MAKYQFSLWDSACIVHVCMYYACNIHVTCISHAHITHATVDMHVILSWEMNWWEIQVLLNSFGCSIPNLLCT